MARRIEYRVQDRTWNSISDQEWAQIKRLEHWYNSEFEWRTGRLAFKMFAIFPNWEKFVDSGDSTWEEIHGRYRQLRSMGHSENAALVDLEREGLVVLKKGGYKENCIASGFTRVAGNEFNAYLVCEFLLKCSFIANHAEFEASDEGDFIKCKHITLRNGVVQVHVRRVQDSIRVQRMVEERHIFSVVDSTKYDKLPAFKNVVHGFNEMDKEERRKVLEDWNWLGFASSYDSDGDDRQGYDLNRKVLGVEAVGG